MEIESKQIQIDKSGQGNAWQAADEDNCPANVQGEIAAEIIDGGKGECDGFTASNGLRYRW